MGRERILRTFFLAAVGLVVFAAAKPTSPDPQENNRARSTWFYINKAHQAPRYDAVIIGDSRGLRGISPAAMKSQLPGLDVFNFSFNAGGMNPEMYRAAEALLSPSSAAPTILLATTSLSFQSWKQDNSQYREYAAKPRDQVWMYLHTGQFYEWLSPLSPGIFFRRMLDLKPAVLLEEDFQADGWIGSDQQPWDDYSDLTEHRQKLAANQADPDLIAQYMSQVRDWTDRGLKVIGFIPPSYAETIRVENEALEFDPVAFRSAFEAAGGTWLDFPSDGYETYDGSHLTRESAVRFSEILAQSMAPHLAAAAGSAMGPTAR